MVPQQSTQTDNPSTDWTRESDESVRITAENVPNQVRRQILREHYEERLARQQAVVASERADRKANGAGVPMFSRADVAVSNTIAVLQDISATLAAFSEGNRDFAAVTR